MEVPPAAAVTVLDGVRVVVAAVCVFTVALYVRLGVARHQRTRRGEPQYPWPKLGMAALVLFLLATASSAVARRGQHMAWWVPISWTAATLAFLETTTSFRFNLHPPWRRPRHSGGTGTRRK